MDLSKPQLAVSIASNRNLIQNIELLFEFVKRDLKSKYKNTFLGILWVILQPLLLTLFFVLLRERFITKFSTYQTDYILMFSVLIVWQFFSTSFQRGTSSVESNYHLIYRIKFPKILLPISVIISAFIDSLVNTSVFFLFLLLFKKVLIINIFYLVFILFISSFFTTALTLFFSVLICFFRDLKHLIPFIVQLSLFGLPIIYDENIIPTQFAVIYQKIPLVWMVTKTKEVLSGNIFFWNYDVIIVLFIGIASLFFAYLFFRRLENFVIDYV